MTAGHGAAELDHNENPLGTSLHAAHRIVEAAYTLHRYPRRYLGRTQRAVAAHFGVDESNVLMTAGVDEASDLILLQGKRVWTFAPGFNGYGERARALSRAIMQLPVDLDGRLLGLPAWAPGDVGLVANPNNPTGALLDVGDTTLLLETFNVICVDETYLDFSVRGRSLISSAVASSNLCVFRSFSKSFGLAGARLGALFGSPQHLDELRARQPFHSVNTIALAGLLGCLQDSRYMRDSITHVQRWRPLLAASLRGRPDIFPEVRETEANFVIARTTLPTDQVCEELLALGFRVQDCTRHGLPNWIRISVGSTAVMEEFMAALSQLHVNTGSQ